MSTDRELLELAAKAAGIWPELQWSGNFLFWHEKYDSEGYHPVWDPLADDGDAFRLASALSMTVEFGNNLVLHPIEVGGEGTDPYSATRRAIVRAAAEIGRAM